MPVLDGLQAMKNIKEKFKAVNDGLLKMVEQNNEELSDRSEP